jgi:hypothetical protein
MNFTVKGTPALSDSSRKNGASGKVGRAGSGWVASFRKPNVHKWAQHRKYLWAPRHLGTVGGQLRINDAVQVKSGRGHLSLAQHNVNLTSVVCVVIKKMAASNMRSLDVVFALIVRVLERATPKSDIEIREE